MAKDRKMCFVSYSREDELFVSTIVEILTAAKNRVFFDVKSLEPGDEWAKKVMSALESAVTVYVFWCAHSKKSRWVSREWRLALRKKKRVVPILLDATPVPPAFAKLQWIDFRGRVSHELFGQRSEPVRACRADEDHETECDMAAYVEPHELAIKILTDMWNAFVRD